MRMLGTADVQEERLARHWHVSASLTCVLATIFLHKGKSQGFSRGVPTFPSRWIPTRAHTHFDKCSSQNLESFTLSQAMISPSAFLGRR